MKIRIERKLYDRVRNCADAVRDEVAVWIAKAIRMDAKGAYPRVSFDDSGALATRASVVARVNWTEPITSRELHGVLQRACAHCEARMPKPFVTPLREGVDYVLEVEA